MSASFGVDFANALPAVVDGYKIIGKTSGGIPVSVAIGDNQASFLGSVRDMESSVLVNVGTGGQVSVLAENPINVAGIEARPCVDGKYLLVGASLCGGRAYAMLEQFFREVANSAGAEVDSMYPFMGELLDKNIGNKLEFDNKFCGTRENSQIRGSVANLGIDNFTMKHFMLGILDGIVSELFEMFEKMNVKMKNLVASGNGIRKNKILQELFAERFGVTLEIPKHKEEAAYGAALFALVAAGNFESIAEAQKLIQTEVIN